MPAKPIVVGHYHDTDKGVTAISQKESGANVLE